jgi:Vitamin K-dependent gamma-carboxylase
MQTETRANRSHRETIGRFFFDSEIPYGMALMRIVLPWTLLINVFQRWPHVREIYSSDGAAAPLADNFGYYGFLPELPGAVAVGLFTALTFLLITTSIGWCTRFSLFVSVVLYSYFGFMDCLSTITKYTVIAAHLLLLLGLSRCGSIWSVDRWLRRRRGDAHSPEDLRAPVWTQRLCQLLLGAIYFGAAITKMHTPTFFSGDQLMYWMMTYVNNQHPLGDLLAQYPLLLSIFGYITITWEMVFLFTVFQPRLKWWVLAIGALFHVMTAFTLGLFIFPLIMMASYLAFLNEAEVRAIFGSSVLRPFLSGFLHAETPAVDRHETAPLVVDWHAGLLRFAGFGLALAAISLGGVEAEHHLDPYQERGPNGPLSPRELTDEEVERFFGPVENLRQVDKLLAFDLGKRTIGEHVIDRRREFAHGESIVAQVTMSPPHEDMWVDCLLTDAVEEEMPDGTRDLVPGKLVSKTGHILPRETFRTNFFFKLDEAFEPGEYFLRLRSGNEEIARRRFTLKASAAAPAAN